MFELQPERSLTAYIRIVNEEEATGALAQDYAFVSDSYSAVLGTHTPTPQVYRTHSIVPPYFHFGAIQHELLYDNGRRDLSAGAAPDILVMFAVARASACFY